MIVLGISNEELANEFSRWTPYYISKPKIFSEDFWHSVNKKCFFKLFVTNKIYVGYNCKHYKYLEWLLQQRKISEIDQYLTQIRQSYLEKQ